MPCPTAHVQFMAWAKAVCDKLIAQGHWADYIDPCSGLPVSGQRPCVYGVAPRCIYAAWACAMSHLARTERLCVCGPPSMHNSSVHIGAHLRPIWMQMVNQAAGAAVYPEVEALSVLMAFKTSNAGCCKVGAFSRCAFGHFCFCLCSCVMMLSGGCQGAVLIV